MIFLNGIIHYTSIELQRNGDKNLVIQQKSNGRDLDTKYAHCKISQISLVE